jgi:hypothetical protein
MKRVNIKAWTSICYGVVIGRGDGDGLMFYFRSPRSSCTRARSFFASQPTARCRYIIVSVRTRDMRRITPVTWSTISASIVGLEMGLKQISIYFWDMRWTGREIHRNKGAETRLDFFVVDIEPLNEYLEISLYSLVEFDWSFIRRRVAVRISTLYDLNDWKDLLEPFHLLGQDATEFAVIPFTHDSGWLWLARDV